MLIDDNKGARGAILLIAIAHDGFLHLHEYAADLESCSRRLEIWSETPDPELEHFEKYQRVVGVLKSIPGITVIDPAEPSFL